MGSLEGAITEPPAAAGGAGTRDPPLLSTGVLQFALGATDLERKLQTIAQHGDAAKPVEPRLQAAYTHARGLQPAESAERLAALRAGLLPVDASSAERAYSDHFKDLRQLQAEVRAAATSTGSAALPSTGTASGGEGAALSAAALACLERHVGIPAPVLTDCVSTLTAALPSAVELHAALEDAYAVAFDMKPDAIEARLRHLQREGTVPAGGQRMTDSERRYATLFMTLRVLQRAALGPAAATMAAGTAAGATATAPASDSTGKPVLLATAASSSSGAFDRQIFYFSICNGTPLRMQPKLPATATAGDLAHWIAQQLQADKPKDALVAVPRAADLLVTLTISSPCMIYRVVPHSATLADQPQRDDANNATSIMVFHVPGAAGALATSTLGPTADDFQAVHLRTVDSAASAVDGQQAWRTIGDPLMIPTKHAFGGRVAALTRRDLHNLVWASMRRLLKPAAGLASGAPPFRLRYFVLDTTSKPATRRWWHTHASAAHLTDIPRDEKPWVARKEVVVVLDFETSAAHEANFDFARGQQSITHHTASAATATAPVIPASTVAGASAPAAERA